MPLPPFQPDLDALIADYRNTAEGNDAMHRRLTAATDESSLLKAHRQHVEKHKLGFGDPAFHAMWARLLDAAAARFGEVRALEIGVYKGQVISLWSLLGRERGLKVRVTALSPFAGQPAPRHHRLIRWLRYSLDARFRERIQNGDFYAEENYEQIVRQHFAHHDLNFDDVRVLHGYSTDLRILEQITGETFHLIYVDGDHTLAGARHDFTTFAPKVVPGGWLIADDASCDLPGTSFWKGHAAVSEAVRDLPALGFTNVLNVGHNRVYQRNPS